MTLELWVYGTGLAAVLSAIPYLRVLRVRMELTRARVFLRWSSYTRTLRLGGLVLTLFLAVVAASVLWEPEEATLRAFMPVGVFIVLLQSGTVYLGWTLIDIARGPREKRPGFLLLGPGLGAKAALLVTGVPAIAAALYLTLRVPYNSEVVKARFFLHFARTHKAHQLLVVLAVVGIVINLAYTAANRDLLYEERLSLPAGVSMTLFHAGFILFASFITWVMSGGFKK